MANKKIVSVAKTKKSSGSTKKKPKKVTKVESVKKSVTKKAPVKKIEVVKKPATKKAPVKKVPVKKSNNALVPVTINNNGDNKKTKKKFMFTWKTFLSILLGLGIIGVTAVLGFGLYIIFSAPNFDKDLLYDKEMTVLLDKNGDEFAKIGAENREMVYYEELPQTLVDAIIATEDSRFFQHNGFDLARFTKAGIQQLFGNSGAGGASTLTMQVTKQRLTSYDSTGFDGITRKFTDIYLSIFKLEETFTKQEIIEFYVNIPWLGNGTWGVEAASQKYFGKSVKDLSLTESALMAGIFNLPANYNPYSNEELADKRRGVVLDLMVRHGYITEEQSKYAKAIPVSSLLVPEEDRSKGLNKYQSFIDTVTAEVFKNTDLDPGVVPMVIETTMDPRVQDVLVKLSKGDIYKFVDDVIQTAVAITDVKDGSIAGVLGQRNQQNEKVFNYATQMKTHPGSAAKPFFAYGPYLEYNNGSTATYFFDERYNYSDGGTIKNADGTYNGLLTMREALSMSRNPTAVQAFQQTNKSKINSFIKSLGINYQDESLHEAMALGGFDGMSPLDMSAAYAAFASGGYYTEPYSYTKVTVIETDDVFTQKPKKKKVMSAETAYMMNSMLMSTTKRGIAGNINVYGTNVAAKSGTSTYDYKTMINMGFTPYVASSVSRDNWVGVYSPDYSIGVWYGYGKLSLDHYTTSISGHYQRSLIASTVANRVFKKNSRFSIPSGVVRVAVEKETFPLQLASEYTPANMILKEYFRKGTEPTDVSPRYDVLPNVSDGKATNNDDSTLLSWSGIKNDISSPDYLKTYFDEYYKKWSTKYYDKRIAYNNDTMGNLVYEIYLKDGGNLTKVGETANNNFAVTCEKTSCTYVVKSAYTIFKANASSGLEITALGNNSDSEEVSLTLVDGSKVCREVGSGNFDIANQIKVTVGGTRKRSGYDVNYSIKKNGADVSDKTISLSSADNYEITYTVTYKGMDYSTKQTLNVCDSGCNSNNTCN